MKRDTETIESIERRRFFELTGKYGFTAAVVAGAAGSLLISEDAAAASAKEERERENGDHGASIEAARRCPGQTNAGVRMGKLKV